MYCHDCGRPTHECDCHRCGTCPPPPCPPARPVEAVFPPSSTTQKLCHLEGEQKRLRHQVEQLLKEGNCALEGVRRAAGQDGAYYSNKEVSVERGYSADDSANYTLIRKRACDLARQPIKMQLHLAYGNPTNSQLKEGAFIASEVEYADKMVSAIPVTGTGWYGHVLVDGAPADTNDAPDLYTVGFTTSGRMKVYKNSAVNIDDLRRDRIVNSMGCAGMLVNGKQVLDPSYYANVPGYDQPNARVIMGQNYESKDVYILVCGHYDGGDHGMLTQTCAEIMARYCDIAVELCEANDAVGLDRGKMLFTPNDAKVPSIYAYWFISKKNCHWTRFTRDLAWLTQRLGQLEWKYDLANKRIDDLEEELCEVIDRVTNLEDRMDDAEKRIAELESRVTAIEQKITEILADIAAIYELIAKLREDLEQEIADRIAADAELQRQIDELTEHVNSEIERLDALIAALDVRVTKNEADIAQLSIDVDALRVDLEALKLLVQQHYDHWLNVTTLLSNRLSNLEQRQSLLEEQMTALDATMTQILQAITNIEIALENLKQLYLDLLERVIALEADHHVRHYLLVPATAEATIVIDASSIDGIDLTSNEVDVNIGWTPAAWTTEQWTYASSLNVQVLDAETITLAQPSDSTVTPDLPADISLEVVIIDWR